MSRKKSILPNVMPVVAWLVILAACAAPARQEAQHPYGSRLLAEHSMMKKRLPLIERENDVFKKENGQLRKQVQELEIRVEDMNRKFNSMEKKHTSDMALAEDRITNLQDTIQEKDRVSVEKIQTLVSLNHDLEAETKSLNKQMAGQKKAFDREREQILRTSVEKESKLSGQLNEIKETVKSRESEIASLRTTAEEKAVKLEEATALAEALKKAIKNVEAELETVRAVNTDLAGRLKTVSNTISKPDSQPR